MAKPPKSHYTCQTCGHRSPKWLGRCSECNGWGTLVEEVEATQGPVGASGLSGGAPISATLVDGESAPRISTGIGELDRVLGGGLVPGSLVLVGGDPGIGKSTLLLQASAELARGAGGLGPGAVLYASAEESVAQVAMRAARVNAKVPELLLYAETDLEKIVAEARRLRPRALVVDSVQTVYSPRLESVPGSIGQVREVAARLMTFAKQDGVPTFLVGHVTKDGAIAGPKTLEHMVDAVVYFEGDRSHAYRVLRAVKNRFGSISEMGVFEMRAGGLFGVDNPSALFLAERPEGAPGSVVASSLEGSRPLLVEVQALVAGATGTPRRTALGVDHNRVALLLAVLERRAGLIFLTEDVYVNVAGGVRLDEPAVDLAICCAIASSHSRRAGDPRAFVFGEVGLTGEVRAVSLPELRLAEAEKLGFRRCILPETNRKRLLAEGWSASSAGSRLELIGVGNVEAALRALIP